MSQQDKKLTGVFGHPVSDRENSMTAGPRGPLFNARYLLFRANVPI